MALRGRVPKHKTLKKGQKRNKNPKLSPYQKEQKRDKLANQAPINHCKRDFPAKARQFQHYMNAKRDREVAKKEARQEAQQAADDAADEEEEEEEGESETESEAVAVVAASAKRKNKGAIKLEGAEKTDIASIGTSVKKISIVAASEDFDEEGNPIAKKAHKNLTSMVDMKVVNAKLKLTDTKTDAQLHNERILKLKEKSLLKKADRRKGRAVERNEAIKVELDQGLKKKRQSATKEELAEERKMEKQMRLLDKNAGVTTAPGEDGDDVPTGPQSSASAAAQERANNAARIALDKSTRGKRNRSGEEADEEGDENHHKKHPKVRFNAAEEVDEKVDVPRFGERVDAPPVFDKAPSANRHSLLPVHRMGNAKKLELSDRKRLEKLGLLPAMEESAGAGALSGSGFHRTTAPLEEGSNTAPEVPAFIKPSGAQPLGRPTTAEGFEAMRLQVLERYAKKRAPSAVFQPGDYFTGGHGKKRRDR